MKAIRRVVAVTLVATALCADRAVAVPAAVRPDPANLARGKTLVARLTVNLRRSLPALQLVQARRDQDSPSRLIRAAFQSVAVVRSALSPFQFRLPPPTAC